MLLLISLLSSIAMEVKDLFSQREHRIKTFPLKEGVQILLTY